MGKLNLDKYAILKKLTEGQSRGKLGIFLSRLQQAAFICPIAT
jgi:hypothetical protein